MVRHCSGGIFTTPPAVVAPTQNRLDLFGLGLDCSVYHKTCIMDNGDHWSPDWENLGGNFSCTPVVLSSSATHIDLFGLGVDQSMLHRSLDGNRWNNWDQLGSAFTSPPVVLPGVSGTFDIFARGLDFLIYRTTWTAASSPAAIRVRSNIFVFVTGIDGAIWYTVFDGNYWKAWASLDPLAGPALLQALKRELGSVRGAFSNDRPYRIHRPSR